MDAKVSIEGLAEFNRGLRQINSDAPKQLRIALNGAADLLVARTAPKVPRKSGAAAKSLKAKSTRTSARVSMGGRRAPYTPWLDFGGKVGRLKSVERPFYKEGRYLYPTLRRISPQIEDKLLSGIKDVARGAGLDVT